MTQELSSDFYRGATVAVERAVVADAARVFELREAAARWMQRRGIEQWDPGEVSLKRLVTEVSRGEWFVVRESFQVIAAVRLLEEDEELWGPQQVPARYLHGLMIDRARAGQGLGLAVLAWAEAQTRASGREVLRLDSVVSNVALRGYYNRAGFTEVGLRSFDNPAWRPAVLLEKRLDASSAAPP